LFIYFHRFYSGTGVAPSLNINIIKPPSA